MALDANDAGCRWMLGHVLGYGRRFAESDEAFALALQLDPNDADAWAMAGDASVFRGDPATAIALIEKALRLNPHPPQAASFVPSRMAPLRCSTSLAATSSGNAATCCSQRQGEYGPLRSPRTAPRSL